MRGELEFRGELTAAGGVAEGAVGGEGEGCWRTIPLAEGAEQLIGTLRMLGYKTAILSGGFTFFARHLQERLGIDYVHANELEIVDGVVTGRVMPPIVNGERKAALLREIAERENISLEQVVAVGDGANDIPMLKVAGMGIAYRAKPMVRESAPQAVSALGLDGLLYLIGVRERDLRSMSRGGSLTAGPNRRERCRVGCGSAPVRRSRPLELCHGFGVMIASKLSCFGVICVGEEAAIELGLLRF